MSDQSARNSLNFDINTNAVFCVPSHATSFACANDAYLPCSLKCYGPPSFGDTFAISQDPVEVFQSGREPFPYDSPSSAVFFPLYFPSPMASFSIWCRSPAQNVDNICIIAKAQDESVGNILPQKLVWPMYSALFVKPGAVHIAGQPMDEHNINTCRIATAVKHFHLYISLSQRLDHSL